MPPVTNQMLNARREDNCIAVSRQTQFTTGRMKASTSTNLILWRTYDAVIVHCGVPK